MAPEEQNNPQDNSSHAFPWHGDASARATPPQPSQTPVSAPQPAEQPRPPVQPSKRPTIKAVTTAVVIAIGLVSLLFSILFATGVFGTLSYDELTRTSTTADTTENISVLHPVEMEPAFVGSAKLELIHRGDDGRGMIAELSMDSMFFGSEIDQATEELTTGLADEESEIYQAIFDGSQLDQENVRNMTFGSFSPPESMHPSIKEARIADLSYQIPFVDDQEEFITIKGKLLYLIGEGKVFTVRLSALESVWKNNEAVFAEMIDGIQIEQ